MRLTAENLLSFRETDLTNPLRTWSNTFNFTACYELGFGGVCQDCPNSTVFVTRDDLFPGDCMCLQQYYWEESTDMCVRCPTGTTAELGSTELTDCKCPQQYVWEESTDMCVRCPTGTTTTLGSTQLTYCKCISEHTSWVDGDCECLQQYYWEGSTDMCVRCPTGTTAALGSTELTDCTCIPGHTSWADGVVCDMCDRNWFKPTNGIGACTRCPLHSHSDGKHTSCICDEGFYKDEGFYVETTMLACKASDAILNREEGSPCECEAA
jgi:hypothetical protein